MIVMHLILGWGSFASQLRARTEHQKGFLRLSDEGLPFSYHRIRIGIPRFESSIIFTWLETKHLTSETTTSFNGYRCHLYPSLLLYPFSEPLLSMIVHHDQQGDSVPLPPDWWHQYCAALERSRLVSFVAHTISDCRCDSGAAILRPGERRAIAIGSAHSQRRVRVHVIIVKAATLPSRTRYAFLLTFSFGFILMNTSIRISMSTCTCQYLSCEYRWVLKQF